MPENLIFSSVVSLSEGRLNCSIDPDDEWCDHMDEVIASYGDAKAWENAESEDWEGLVYVPVVPTEGCFAMCRLYVDYGDLTQVEPPAPAPVRRVSWIRDEASGQRIDTERYQVDLGRYMPGEGLITWGGQIWDLFVGLHADEELEKGCHYSLHVAQSRAGYRARLENTHTRFAEAWSLYFMGRCINCDKIHQELLGHSDLVPEVGQRGWPKPPSSPRVAEEKAATVPSRARSGVVRVDPSLTGIQIVPSATHVHVIGGDKPPAWLTPDDDWTETR